MKEKDEYDIIIENAVKEWYNSKTNKIWEKP